MEGTDIKNITETSIKRICRDSYDKKHYLKWNGVNLVIKNIITLDEFTSLIGIILDAITLDSGDIDIMRIDFIEKLYIIAFYSNIDMPRDIDEQYKLIYGTDIFDIVIQYCSKNQVQSIFDCVKNFIGN